MSKDEQRLWLRFNGRSHKGGNNAFNSMIGHYKRTWEKGFIFLNKILPIFKDEYDKAILFEHRSGIIFGTENNHKHNGVHGVYFKTTDPKKIHTFLSAFAKSQGGNPKSLEWQIISAENPLRVVSS